MEGEPEHINYSEKTDKKKETLRQIEKRREGERAREMTERE